VAAELVPGFGRDDRQDPFRDGRGCCHGVGVAGCICHLVEDGTGGLESPEERGGGFRGGRADGAVGGPGGVQVSGGKEQPVGYCQEGVPGAFPVALDGRLDVNSDGDGGQFSREPTQGPVEDLPIHCGRGRERRRESSEHGSPLPVAIPCREFGEVGGAGVAVTGGGISSDVDMRTVDGGWRDSGGKGGVVSEEDFRGPGREPGGGSGCCSCSKGGGNLGSDLSETFVVKGYPAFGQEGSQDATPSSSVGRHVFRRRGDRESGCEGDWGEEVAELTDVVAGRLQVLG